MSLPGAPQVAPDYRRQHLAQKLMGMLEHVTETVGCWVCLHFLQQLQQVQALCLPACLLQTITCGLLHCSSQNLYILIYLQVHNGYFVDLFVRKSNALAIGMYEKFGYVKYREVRGEDALPRRLHPEFDCQFQMSCMAELCTCCLLPSSVMSAAWWHSFCFIIV
jgi:GNAT superfamily N-acetyltransferase